MIKNSLIALSLFLTGNILASNLSISTPVLYLEEDIPYVLLNVSWENAWNNEKNNDAVWLFFKFLKGPNGYSHAPVKPSGHEVTMFHSQKKTDLTFDVPEDQTGVFISAGSNFRGNISATIKVILDKERFERVNIRWDPIAAFAIEMVRIPSGAFVIGDTDSTTTKFGTLYQSNAAGKHAGLYEVKREDQVIKIAPEQGSLYYQNPEGYEGDQKGTLPADYPKGVEGFYIMKYEPTQGQYADFLNSLNVQQSQNRANFGGKDYYSHRGTIKMEAEKYIAESPHAPCNFISWDDAMAYADWAGLRPMTELEFVKAARGTERPKEGRDLPWGNASKTSVQRMVSEDGTLKMLNHWEESMLSDDTKAAFGASYYWVMDLSGSLWERVITIGDEKGRSFKGTHGDGQLSGYGFATNEDWPRGIEEPGGYGFRGGGFYGYNRSYHEYNPFSPVSFRRYGGWSGGSRTNAYGARFVKKMK